MSTTWTVEQILTLAPDHRAAKAGQVQAQVHKWTSLGRNENALWGLCQGSAKRPYQAQIDLSEPAFRCTCPSRKFPCKHALGLFLLQVKQPDAFTQDSPPDWVAGWLAKRTQRAQRTTAKDRSTTKTDTAARNKRLAQRETKVKAGLAELELWLRDLVRQGLAVAQAQPNHYWGNMAARMVDAQAPGIAQQLREIASLSPARVEWPEQVLARLGRLHLLARSFRHLEALPQAVQAEIRTLIGWTERKEDLLTQPGDRDHWLVLGQRVTVEDRLRSQRIWLWGQAHQQTAFVLNFARDDNPLDLSLPPGTCLEADLVFYPGLPPQRALIKTRHTAPRSLTELPGYATIAAATEAYAAALAQNPWLAQFPMALQEVTLLRRDEHWVVRDIAGHILPLETPSDQGWRFGWRLLAISGGYPITLFGEWNGHQFYPLSSWAENRYVPLTQIE